MTITDFVVSAPAGSGVFQARSLVMNGTAGSIDFTAASSSLEILSTLSISGGTATLSYAALLSRPPQHVSRCPPTPIRLSLSLCLQRCDRCRRHCQH